MTTLPMILEHQPLAPLTAWRIGGPARWLAVATSQAELLACLLWARQKNIPVFMLGGGSNLLMSDAGWPGLVIRYRAQEYQIAEQDETILLTIDAGAPMAGTARKLAARGYAGLEWAEGLPGTVGGAIYGNAGCYGSSTAECLIDATLVLPDGQVETWPAEQLEYSYRSSTLKRQAHLLPARAAHGPVVLGATLRMAKADPAQLSTTIAEIAVSRKSKTPSGSSCGSVFKNPPGTTAGTLLDQAGLKGRTVGGAQVALKHANYIVNLGGATASDVLQLADIMREEVVRQFGIELQLEVQVVGAETPSPPARIAHKGVES